MPKTGKFTKCEYLGFWFWCLQARDEAKFSDRQLVWRDELSFWSLATEIGWSNKNNLSCYGWY